MPMGVTAFISTFQVEATMRKYNFLSILFFIIFYGCSSQTSKIEDILQKDHLIAVQTVKLEKENFENQKVNLSLASAIQNRLSLIHSMENLYDGKNEEITFVLAFLNAENTYCISLYDQTLAMQNAKRFNEHRSDDVLQQLFLFDVDSKRRAQKMVRVRKELMRAELHLSKYHWLPVWATNKFNELAQS